MKIKSIFEQIATKVFVMDNFEEAKRFIEEFVNDSRIKESDKLLIINNLNEIKNMRKLHQYICNSLLKYEGMGVI
jgi:hypothetical protein